VVDFDIDYPLLTGLDALARVRFYNRPAPLGLGENTARRYIEFEAEE